MRNELWTDEQTQMLVTMKNAGHSYSDIARAVGRTNLSVQERWYWINRSDEKKAARRVRMNLRRAALRHSPSTEIDRAVIKQFVPEQILLDREMRHSTPPRNLTAAFCGDPLPGYSALERRA